jgi:tetratricopeptide (TPR) repeat protein
MPGCPKKILKLISSWSLIFCLFAGWMGSGCTKNVRQGDSDNGRTWSCDDKADEAMLRQDYQAGVLLHDKVLKKDPTNALALYHLGYAYGQMGEHSKEAFCYEKAIALGFVTETIYFNLGMAYGELNEIEDSISAFRKALKINPWSPDSHFGLAMAYYQKGIVDHLAEEEFLKTIAIDPAYIDARLYLSILYADRGELQKACHQLREILKIDPTNVRARRLLERIEKE